MNADSFQNDYSIKPIQKLADLWLAEPGNQRLLLPPIQRSIVWTNEQVINYWDSLLRGYPPGMMIIHQLTRDEQLAHRKGRDADNNTCEATENDLLLIDGQQRMVTVLLGFGKGPSSSSRKLWVDLAKRPIQSSGLKFQLRMSSVGQPFGYRPEAASQRCELNKRTEQLEKWMGKKETQWKKEHQEAKCDSSVKEQIRNAAFESVEGDDLVDSICAVPFAEVLDDLHTLGLYNTILKLKELKGAAAEIVDDFVPALECALKTKIILQPIGSEIAANSEELIRFFRRIGQGGARLTDDELTYSILKHQYPEIHDRLAEIMRDVGRWAGEVDLVLAALRSAKVLALGDAPRPEWEIIGRPNPSFAARLEPKVSEEFEKLLPASGDRPNDLKGILKTLRDALLHEDKGTGLPKILLARLPSQLLDVLIFLAAKRSGAPFRHDECETLRAFVLHWLLFVANNDKAAWGAFQHMRKASWLFSKASMKLFVQEFEQEGFARFMPRKKELEILHNDMENCKDQPQLRSWSERFAAADTQQFKPGETIRILATHQELVKRALMWLQREYLAKFRYDPTSDRDEDLPVDLDHIVPASTFYFNWGDRGLRLEEGVDLLNFQRRAVEHRSFAWKPALAGCFREPTTAKWPLSLQMEFSTLSSRA